MSARIDNELHRLRGTRPTRESAIPSRVAGGRPKMPLHMTGIAADRWKEMVKILRARGTLTKGDGPALELYCETYGRWRACLKEVEEHGVMVDVTVLSSSGAAITKRVQNPAAKLAAQMENSLRAMLKEFSATPASRERTRPAAPKEAKDEPIEI